MASNVEALFARLVESPELDPNDPVAARAFLAGLELDEPDRAALLADFPKLWVYRELVRSTLREAIELTLPRSVARLGPLFDEYFTRFVVERGSRSPYLRDVSSEFIAFVAPLWPEDARVPPWLFDLLRHEAIHLVIGAKASPPEFDIVPGELALDRGVAFVAASALVHYGYAVHRLSDDPADCSEPERQATSLFVYRSPEHDVRYLELSPLAEVILRRLLAGNTLQEALGGAAAERGVPLTAQVLEGAARLLSDLSERGALLGARGKPPPA